MPANVTEQRTANTGRTVFVVFGAAIALFCALYLERIREVAFSVRYETATGLLHGIFSWSSLMFLGTIFLVLLVAFVLVSRHPKVIDWIIDHRYPLAGAVLALLVLFQINGSSLALWGARFGDDAFNGVLFGLPRDIRTDEWCVLTPFTMSQAHDGFSGVSPIIRAADTNVTMTYALPTWSISTLFRPFLWGYLVLGVTRGLSFFWCGRAIALVLVSFEFFMLFSKGRRHLAAYGALLVGFAPIVEWWFAVNGTAELFIFGQGLVIALHHLLRANTTARRWACSAILAWLLGCYALILYPAWQIPFVYVFGACGIADLLSWVKETDGPKIRRQLRSIVVPVLLTIICVVGCVVLCFVGAQEAIRTTMQTAYPGERFEVGGGMTPLLWNNAKAPLTALASDRFLPNVCEGAAFISLFPLGVILGIFVLVSNRRAGGLDKKLALPLIVYAFLLGFGVFGFPPLLAKITLMANVTFGRLPLALGYLDVLLLVRASAVLMEARASQPDGAMKIARLRDAAPSWVSVVASIGISVLVLLLVRHYASELVSTSSGIGQAVVLAFFLVFSFSLLFFPYLLPERLCAPFAKGRETLILVSALVVVTAGISVNPLQTGTDALTNNPELLELATLSQEQPEGAWLTDDSIDGQACIAQGIPTIDCVNVYPNLERWEKLDPTGQWKDCYNRYAHIDLEPGEQTTFKNDRPDQFHITLAPDDVAKIGAKYWLSKYDLEEWNTENTEFIPIREVGERTVYRIESTA